MMKFIYERFDSEFAQFFENSIDSRVHIRGAA